MSSSVIKNGKIQEKQRYKCKNCAFQFTRITPRGHTAKEKATAIILYTLGLSMNAIAKLFNVSAPAVLYWIRNFAIANYEKPIPGNAIIIELDEMHHFIKKKKINFGYGKHVVEILENLSIGNAVVVIKKHSLNYIID